MKDTGLQFGVYIYAMLPGYTFHQYTNTECNNYYQSPLLMNGNISTLKKLISFNSDFNLFNFKKGGNLFNTKSNT